MEASPGSWKQLRRLGEFLIKGITQSSEAAAAAEIKPLRIQMPENTEEREVAAAFGAAGLKTSAFL